MLVISTYCRILFTSMNVVIIIACRLMKERKNLDSCLARALGVPLVEGRLKLIDECDYVLTLDFASKMTNIHERRKCGIPVIIEGETGVGKTFLIEMLSKLWNYKYACKLKFFKEEMLNSFQEGELCTSLNVLLECQPLSTNYNQSLL